MYMNVIINDNFFDVKCVITKKDIQNGMQNRKFDGFDGMLFIMDESQHSFWMKDCVISLDIIFVLDNTITKIYTNCHPCLGDDCEQYFGYGNLVLELPGNSCNELNINIGDRLFFE